MQSNLINHKQILGGLSVFFWLPSDSNVLCSLIGLVVALVFVSYIDQIPKFFIEPSKYEFYRSGELFVNKENFIKLTTAIFESVVRSLSSFSKGQIFHVNSIALFCNGSACTYQVNCDFYYRDDNHFNLIGLNYVSLIELEKYFTGEGSKNR
jgi:hypothetical protein